MTDPRCDDVRALLERGESASAAEHLAGCAGCRAEARHIQRLTAWLASDALLEPPRGLDRSIRALLAADPGGVFQHPWLAGGVTVAAFASVVSALAIALASTPAAEFAPLLAVGLGVAYLSLSAAVALPLMLRAAHGRVGATEGGT